MHDKRIQFFYLNSAVDIQSGSLKPQFNSDLYVPLSRNSEQKVDVFVGEMSLLKD